LDAKASMVGRLMKCDGFRVQWPGSVRPSGHTDGPPDGRSRRLTGDAAGVTPHRV